MEKKLLNQKLLQALITSDFLFLEQNQLKKNFFFSDVNTFAFKTQTLTTLDPLETVLNLKQLIRLLLNLKKSRLKTKINFFLDDDNHMINPLIEKFFEHPSIHKHVCFEINTHKLPKEKKDNRIHYANLTCIIEGFYNQNFFKKQLKKRQRLFLRINSQFESEIDSYKIFNNFNDYKKILFFFSFIRQIILNLYPRKKKYAIKKKV